MIKNYFIIAFFLVLSVGSSAQSCDKVNIVFTGNSLFQKWPQSDTGETAPTYVFRRMLKAGYVLSDSVNLSEINQNTGAMEAEIAKLKTLYKPNQKNILIAYEGCNTISQWSWTAKQFASWFFDYTRSCQKIGYQVVVPTQIAFDPEWSYDTINFPVFIRRYQFSISDPIRRETNQILRDSQKAVNYMLVDMASVAGFITQNDTKNRKIYYDGLHLTDDGRKLLANGIVVKIDSILCKRGITSTKNLPEYTKMKVYPNPSVDEIYVEDPQGNVKKIDITRFPTGLNIIREGNRVMKFIKL